MMKAKLHRYKGYTLIELMMVVAIIGVIGSIVWPQYELLLVKANQAKTKSNLGSLRSAINLYYSKYEGVYPFRYTGDLPDYPRASLSSVLVPDIIGNIPTPILKDISNSFNGLSMTWDTMAIDFVEQRKLEVWINQGPAQYTMGLYAPYVYDNVQGSVYIPNGNYDSSQVNYFYNW